MMENNKVIEAAQLLIDCRIKGSLIDSLPPELRPQTISDGYRIQHALIGSLSGQVCGAKVGLTSPDAQSVFETAEPISGTLLEEHVYIGPAILSADAYPMRGIEAEIVFVIGEDLMPREQLFGPDEILSTVESLRPAIEICDSRSINCDIVGLPSIFADNSNAGALVVGPPVTNWRDFEMAGLGVTLNVGRQRATKGSASSVLGNPANSLAWLANHLTAHGGHLSKGQLVASGSLTGITMAGSADQTVADFEKLGMVSVEFIANRA